jgi:hypothetical protein
MVRAKWAGLVALLLLQLLYVPVMSQDVMDMDMLATMLKMPPEWEAVGNWGYDRAEMEAQLCRQRPTPRVMVTVGDSITNFGYTPEGWGTEMRRDHPNMLILVSRWWFARNVARSINAWRCRWVFSAASWAAISFHR